MSSPQQLCLGGQVCERTQQQQQQHVGRLFGLVAACALSLAQQEDLYEDYLRMHASHVQHVKQVKLQQAVA